MQRSILIEFSLIIAAGITLTSMPAKAQSTDFHAGDLIKDFGPIATIENRETIPEGTRFKISYDVLERAKYGEINRTLITAARFLNMHHEAGIDKDHMALAIVVHGPAVHDMTNSDFRNDTDDDDNGLGKNPNALLVKALLENNVHIYVCGQSAAYQGIKTEDLLPGVTMSLSAMTAHALLQQSGYTLNPF